MSLLLLVIYVPFVLVCALGLMRLFLAPIFNAMSGAPARATQYFTSDLLLFLLLFGGLASVLAFLSRDEMSLLVVLGVLLVVLGLIWLAGCHVLSRLNVRAFWPRAVGLTCLPSAMISALGLAITFIPVLMVFRDGDPLPLAVWLAGLPLALVLSRLGASFVLRHAEAEVRA